MKKPIDIVMIDMSNFIEWEERGVSNRNYHILRELERSHDVAKILAVDYPAVTRKRTARNIQETILKNVPKGRVIYRSIFDKVTKISERLFVYSNWEFFMRPNDFVKRLKNAALRLNFSDYIVWSYFPFIMPYVRGMGQRLTVFDAVDNWTEHSSYADFKERLKQCYKTITSDTDVIFTVADELQTLFGNQPNVFWIPNGVDLTHYQDEHILLNRDIADIPRPIIGYIGVVQGRVDVDLIVFLAQKNPTKSLVIVGPVWKETDKAALRSCKNVYLLGRKSYGEAPAYIQQFDVGIIPHKKSEFVTSTNPMKLYEYLACGKPVVATAGSGAEQFAEFTYIAADYEDFNRKIFSALHDDTPKKREERKNAMKDYSWGVTVKHMLDIIQKKLSY